MAAWLSKPKGVLPNDDSELARASDLTMLEFATLKNDLLHGFIVKDDKLMHPVILEKAANKPKRERPDYGAYSEDFERFWKAYDAPKIAPSAHKLEAWRAWNSVLSTLPSIENLLECVSLYRASLRRNGRDDLFAKHPSSWLRARGFEAFNEASALTPQQIEANKDRADKIMRRGRYADRYQ